MLNPLVSVIVTSYNQQELLNRAVASVLEQTYSPIEIIIVDDFSTDGSRDWIIDIANTHPEKIRYCLQPQNVGIPRNKNTGFRLAKGEFITYLDGDDTYYSTKIEKEVGVFQLQPEYDVVYSNFDFKEFDGRFIKTWAEVQLPEGDIFKPVVQGLFPHKHLHRFEMFRRKVMYDLGFYDESFSIYHDLDFMMRYAAKYKVGNTLNVGSTYFMNPSSIVSSTKQWNMTLQHRQVFLKLKNLFEQKGMEKEYRSCIKESDLNLLYAPPRIQIGSYIVAALSQPSKVMKIAKAFYYSLSKV